LSYKARFTRRYELAENGKRYDMIALCCLRQAEGNKGQS